MSRNAGSGKDEAFVPSDDTEITTAEELSYRLHQQELLSQFGLFISRRVNLGDIMSEVARTGANGLGVKLCKALELIQCMDEPRLLVRSGVGWAEGVVGHATVGADLEFPAGFRRCAWAALSSPTTWRRKAASAHPSCWRNMG